MSSGLMTGSYDEAAAAVPVERTICSLWCVCVCDWGKEGMCGEHLCLEVCRATVVYVHTFSSLVMLSRCFEEKTPSMSDLWFLR